MSFVLGKTEQELQAQRANTLREIEARGGRAKAPNFATRLDQIDAALRNLRTGAQPAPAPAAPQAPATPAAPSAPASPGFTLGASEQELQQQRANTLREIEARGGKDKAPNYADRLNQIDAALRGMRAGAPAAPQAPAAPVDPAAPPTTTSSAPVNSPVEVAPIPKQITNVQEGVAAEKAVADAEAKGQIAYGNAAREETPFGEQTIEFDANGRPVVKQELSPDQQQILDQQQDLSKAGTAAAQNIITAGGLNDPFAPKMDDRVAEGDLLNWRRKQQEDLENYLTRNIERDKSRDLNTLETSLYNRGIPLDRQAEAYDRAIEGLNNDYNSRRADAAAQALEFGRAEAQTTYDMNEGTRRNQLNEQQTTRQQNVGDAQTLGTVGSGIIVPKFNPFTGGTFDLNSPVDIDRVLKELQEAKRRRELEEQLARQAAAARGGGGSNGNTGTVAQSPFVDS